MKPPLQYTITSIARRLDYLASLAHHCDTRIRRFRTDRVRLREQYSWYFQEVYRKTVLSIAILGFWVAAFLLNHVLLRIPVEHVVGRSLNNPRVIHVVAILVPTALLLLLTNIGFRLREAIQTRNVDATGTLPVLGWGFLATACTLIVPIEFFLLLKTGLPLPSLPLLLLEIELALVLNIEILLCASLIIDAVGFLAIHARDWFLERQIATTEHRLHGLLAEFDRQAAGLIYGLNGVGQKGIGPARVILSARAQALLGEHGFPGTASISSPMGTHRYTRRTLLQRGGQWTAGVSILATGNGLMACATRRSRPNPVPILEAQVTASMLPFGNGPANPANTAATDLGITAGDFFIISKSLVRRLSGFTDSVLYPIYPLAVLARAAFIDALAQAFHLPPNIIAILMAIESAGVANAGSGAGAIGLFQPLQDKFPPEVQAINERDRLQAMRDPWTNAQAGLSYFVTTCLPEARRTSGFPPMHAVTFAWAFAAYNAGPGWLSSYDDNPYDVLPVETKFYIDSFIRFALTAEIAARLKAMGYSDDGIMRSLVSHEVDRRAFALERYLQHARQPAWTDTDAFGAYQLACQLLTQVTISDGTGVVGMASPPPLLRESYLAFDAAAAAHPAYRLPFSPGLRIWTALGGWQLLQLDEQNTDPALWRQRLDA